MWVSAIQYLQFIDSDWEAGERATPIVALDPGWAEGNPLLRAYHDEEWGVPEYDSRALWEKLMLEAFRPVCPG